VVTFDLEGKRAEIQQLQKQMEEPTFWNNKDEANKTLQRISHLKRSVEPAERIESGLAELHEMVSLLEEEEDEELMQEAEDLLGLIRGELTALRMQTLMGEEYDKNNAVLSMHPGAGGTESCDWAGMLLRMYQRWAERKGFSWRVVDLQPGEEAGIKSATVIVNGDYAYGLLKGERGVHRLVRISPFDAAGRRHTSFCSVDVVPEVEEDIDIEINDSDLKIDTFRASGPGGQHVNKTESAVRITHIPTGIVVQCQEERSQHRNRAIAMRILKARLFDYYRRQREEEMKKMWGEKGEIGWGNQIRSYVLQPYTLVKDHRTGFEMGNVEAVLNGEIDPFIEAYLRFCAAQRSGSGNK